MVTKFTNGPIMPLYNSIFFSFGGISRQVALNWKSLIKKLIYVFICAHD